MMRPIAMAGLALAVAVAMAGCAANGSNRQDVPPGQQVSWDSKRTLDQALKGLTPGEPVSCLPQTRTPPSEAYGRTVLYRYGRNEVWRNDTGPGCETLGRGDIMVASTPLGRFCRGDIVQVLDRVSRFPTGSCALGDFVPYRRAK